MRELTPVIPNPDGATKLVSVADQITPNKYWFILEVGVWKGILAAGLRCRTTKSRAAHKGYKGVIMGFRWVFLLKKITPTDFPDSRRAW